MRLDDKLTKRSGRSASAVGFRRLPAKTSGFHHRELASAVEMAGLQKDDEI